MLSSEDVGEGGAGGARAGEVGAGEVGAGEGGADEARAGEVGARSGRLSISDGDEERSSWAVHEPRSSVLRSGMRQCRHSR